MQTLQTSRRSRRHIVTTLLKTIDASTHADAASSAIGNHLQHDATPQTRNAFLTLQILFPHELLPALDILDRQLITRLQCVTDDVEVSLLLVQSSRAQSESRRGRSTYETQSTRHLHDSEAELPLPPCHEVRLDAWTCSCPAFVFSAFPALRSSSDSPPPQMIPESDGLAMERAFGGLSLGDDLPVCKHLLACVLGDRCGIFRHCIRQRDCTLEEIAGRAAGWGDL